jgi:pilus assembly protein Flp/PilA
MRSLLKKFFISEKGATAIEYGLIAALIAVAVIAGATTLGTKLDSTFEQISTSLGG